MTGLWTTQQKDDGSFEVLRDGVCMATVPDAQQALVQRLAGYISDLEAQLASTDDVLVTLWSSTQKFYERFGVYPPDFNGQKAAFEEEVQELLYALARQGTRASVEEGVDVLVTVIGLLMSQHITLPFFIAAMEHVRIKNDRKSWKTHFINSAGKIARRPS